MQKKLWVLVFSVMLVCLSGSMVYAKPRVCKIGHVNSAASLFQFQAIEFKKIIEAKMPDMTVELYPAGQIGGSLALMQGLQLNTVQIYPDFTYIWESYVPEFKALAVHYLFKTVEDFEQFCTTPLFEEINQKLVKKAGVRIIGNVDAGGTFQFLSNKPIHNMDDVKGMRNRCAQFAPLLNSWRAYGASPTPLDWGEVYTSLATGLIEGLDNPVMDIYDENFYEVIKYMNMTNNLQVLISYNTSEAFWKTLSSDEKAIFKEAVEMANQKTKAEVKQRFKKIVEDMKSNGVQFINTDTTEFRKAIPANIEKILDGDKDAISFYKRIKADGF